MAQRKGCPVNGSPGQRPGRRTGVALAILVALQVAVLVSMVTLQERTLAAGTIVRLEVAPVDPTDLVRGSYVTLDYAIGNTVASSDGIRAGSEVVVGLEADADGTHVATGAFEHADEADTDLFVRGWVAGHGGDRLERGESLRVAFHDFSTYFASAERARELERLLVDPDGAVAIVSLDERGRGTLCEVISATDTAPRTTCSTSGW